MRITEAEWRNEFAKTGRAPSRGEADLLLQQAAVDSRLLTGHPEWDKYLERLQALVNSSEDELKVWQERFGAAYRDEDLRLVQLNVNVLQDRIRTIKHCMGLPIEILNHAKESSASTFHG